MSKVVEDMISRIAAALPVGWSVRLALMSDNNLEVYHEGPHGGGIGILWCRKVTVIEPVFLKNGSRRGPCGQRDEMGEFKGRGWRDAVVAAVLQGVELFDRKYPYARKDVQG